MNQKLFSVAVIGLGAMGMGAAQNHAFKQG